MYNNGCIVALTNSVNKLSADLEKAKGQIREDVY